MIDVGEEELDVLSRAARWVPRGTDSEGRQRKPSASTIYRWYRPGVAGVQLETVCIGAVRYTSRQALQRFFERVTAVRAGGSTESAPDGALPTIRTRTESQRKRAAATAGQQLDQMIANPPRRGRKAKAAASK